jgi:acetoin utilization deacetylase AcuC-like enzyme
MYKQVAQLTHPDKTNDDLEKSAMFRQAKRAVDNNDLMGMLCLCDDLDIDIPEMNKQHQQTIENNIKQIEQKIKSIKSRDAYAWGVADQPVRHKMEQAILSKFNLT